MNWRLTFVCIIITGTLALEEVMKDFCIDGNMNESTDAAFICQLYQLELKTNANLELTAKYVSYAYLIESLPPSNHGILEGDFFLDLIAKLRLNNLVILIPNWQGLKLMQLKHLIDENFGKINIRIANEKVAFHNELDERTGIFALMNNNIHIRRLHEQHPQATWLFKSLENLNHHVMLADSNVFEYNEAKHISITVNEVYYKVGFGLKKSPWGIWKPRKGFLHLDGHQWQRRKDLTNVVIQGVSLSNPPFGYVTEMTGTDEVIVDGYFGDVWSVLQSTLNFTTVIKKPWDGQWGAQAENGTWVGMIGMLSRNEADVTIADLLLTLDRALVTRISTSIMKSENNIIFRSQKNYIGTDWSMFLQLFEIKLWMVVLLTVLILTFLHSFIETRSYDFPSIFVNAVGILTNQGCSQESNTITTKIILMTLLLSGLLFNAFYSAKLTSFLFVKKFEMPFEDYHTMYYKTNFKLGAVPGSLHYSLLANAPVGSPANLMFQERLVNLKSPHEGYQLLEKRSNFAFFWQKLPTILAIGDNCKVESVKEKTYDLPFFFRKHFPYYEIINSQLKIMKESGQLDALWDKWKPITTKVCYPIASEAIAIGKVITPFAILCCALVLSFIIFLIEKATRTRASKAPILRVMPAQTSSE